MLKDFGKSPINTSLPRPSSIDDMGDEEYLEKNLQKPSQWLNAKYNVYMSTGCTSDTLPSGAYTIKWEGRSEQPMFERTEIKVDNLIFTDNEVSKKVIGEVNIFWDKVDEYKKVGYLHRRGFLLYGSHGSGKTSIIHQIITNLLEQDGLVFICVNPKHFTAGLQEFRKIEPRRKVVCLFEDIDALVREYGENKLLSLLDGEDQIDYVFNLATTNYPEVLDKRIVARPRRFDRLVKVSFPEFATRLAYFESKLHADDDPKKWADESKDLSFASLAELVIAVKCFDESFEETIERLRNLKVQPSSSDGDEDLGF